jgi:hypothetical protein
MCLHLPHLQNCFPKLVLDFLYHISSTASSLRLVLELCDPRHSMFESKYYFKRIKNYLHILFSKCLFFPHEYLQLGVTEVREKVLCLIMSPCIVPFIIEHVLPVFNSYTVHVTSAVYHIGMDVNCGCYFPTLFLFFFL